MNKANFLSAIFLIVLGVFGRLFLIRYIGLPNFEIITALTLVSAVFLGRIWGIVVPLSIIAITDVMIGNSPVLIFTWSAFAIIGVFGYMSRRVVFKDSISAVIASPSVDGRGNPALIAPFMRFFDKLRMTIAKMAGLGIISSIFFFLYTNFGWWLMTNMYPHTLDGLIHCYLMGLPFFKNNLIGNLIFVPMASGIAIYAIALKSKLKMSAFSGSVESRKNHY